MKVSDHAIVRYLERVKGVDIDALRKEILPPTLNKISQRLGNGFYPVGGTHKICVRGGTVVSVLGAGMNIKKKDLTQGMTTRNKTMRKRNRRRMLEDAASVDEYEQFEDADLI